MRCQTFNGKAMQVCGKKVDGSCFCTGSLTVTVRMCPMYLPPADSGAKHAATKCGVVKILVHVSSVFEALASV